MMMKLTNETVGEYVFSRLCVFFLRNDEIIFHRSKCDQINQEVFQMRN